MKTTSLPEFPEDQYEQELLRLECLKLALEHGKVADVGTAINIAKTLYKFVKGEQ